MHPINKKILTFVLSIVSINTIASPHVIQGNGFPKTGKEFCQYFLSKPKTKYCMSLDNRSKRTLQFPRLDIPKLVPPGSYIVEFSAADQIQNYHWYVVDYQNKEVIYDQTVPKNIALVYQNNQITTW